MKNTKLIQSLDRGLEILDLMRKNPQKGYAVKEIGEHLNIDTSSAFRLLNTLEQREYVSKTEGGYFLGSTIYSLYGALAKHFNLPSLMRKYLENITSKTGETSHLAIRQKDRVVFIDRVIGTETISANTDVGQNEPLHCTSVGKALICNMPKDQLKSLLGNKLKGFTPNTLSSLNELFKELQKVKQAGIAFDREEYQPGVMCIAVPIFDGSGKIICSIGMSGPSDRMNKNLAEFSSLVKESGNQASVSLGYLS